LDKTAVSAGTETFSIGQDLLSKWLGAPGEVLAETIAQPGSLNTLRVSKQVRLCICIDSGYPEQPFLSNSTRQLSDHSLYQQQRLGAPFKPVFWLEWDTQHSTSWRPPFVSTTEPWSMKAGTSASGLGAACTFAPLHDSLSRWD
jgi:hypothetical protein